MINLFLKITIFCLSFNLIFFPRTLIRNINQVSKGNRTIIIDGSFAVATICKDGVLIAADSRSTISDTSGSKLAYNDGVQKIFPIGKVALTYTGQETIQNIYFGAIVDAFIRTIKDEIPLDKLIPTFLTFADSHLPLEASLQVRKQAFIAAGFINGKHVATYYNEAQTNGPKTAFGLSFISSDKTILDKNKQLLSNMEPEELAGLIRKAIEKYAVINKFYDIGGPVYVLYISKNILRWIGPEPKVRKWDYFHEFAKAYWNNEIDLHLLSGVERSKVDDLIKQGEEWSKNIH